MKNLLILMFFSYVYINGLTGPETSEFDMRS